MRNEVYERLLEKCGPILRGSCEQRSRSSPEAPESTTSISAGVEYSGRPPPVKGILKKSPLKLRLNLKRPSGPESGCNGDADEEKEADTRYHNQKEGEVGGVQLAVGNRLICDLCCQTFPHSMALKQHKK